MKKIVSTLGAMATVALPLATTIACGASEGSIYFYEIIINPVDIEDDRLEMFILHLPTESDNSISEDFREEYWSRLYGDVGHSLYKMRKTLLIREVVIEYSSIDHAETGGIARWIIDLADPDKFPFSPYITIPEHIAQPGEKIYVEDENGLESLEEATVETLVPKKVFYLHTLQQLFTDEIKEFVTKKSLLLVEPTSAATNGPIEWTPYGYLFRQLLREHSARG